MYYVIRINGKAARFTKDINEVETILADNPGAVFYSVGEIDEATMLEMRINNG